jgi:hypothetical protein
MSSVAGNGVARAKQDPLSSLAQRLPDPQDRDWYAGLVSYIQSLPPEDELVQLAQLFGFLTLIGRELPDAIAAEQTKLRDYLSEAYGKLQQEVKTNASYHEKLNRRLSQLPEEIAEGVQPAAIAKAMSESFRQQLAQTGLQDTGRVLNSSVKDLKTVAGELAQAVKPIQERYGSIGSSIEAEIKKLDYASRQLRQQMENLIAQSNDDRWLWRIGFWVILLFVGFFLGTFWEKNETTSMILELQQQIAQLKQTLKTPPVTLPPSVTLKHPKKG